MSGTGGMRKAVGPSTGAVLSDSTANKREVNDSQVVADALLLMCGYMYLTVMPL